MGKVSFQEELCKGCELCKKACPKGIIVMGEYTNGMGYHTAHCSDQAKCTACASCALVCPDIVITVEREARI